ncbi:hypothetical protein Val02_74700 [Virgisporangium aliadipatigenens]|uniref:Uncharacterized protein n=1 Tax=Virgisporangium aliadipatigenens TaxID=741659 RepID=A0A8J3YRM4_9ACTN|nr:hypothetical protein [Virgisporangium aliadipatigenens]GIJ50584.1 hypothetical protein Val02_74700 [Virgisporangium aliadipatigenens]
MAIAARTVTREDLQQQVATAHARSWAKRREAERVAWPALDSTEVENDTTARS